MSQAEFDPYADRYHDLLASSIASSGETHEYFAAYKIRDLAELWQGSRGASMHVPPKILDFGSGIGTSVPHLLRCFPGSAITCADVSRRSLDLAQSKLLSAASFVHFSGTHLPFPDGKFDLAFAACVFHHIPHREHSALLKELGRVIRGGGMLVLYEHNPLNPLVRRAVASCPFDEDAVLIPAWKLRQCVAAAGFVGTRSAYRVFFPRRARALRFMERGLSWLPLGAQYYVVGMKATSKSCGP
jgi:SAM-dependent methyltransferase